MPLDEKLFPMSDGPDLSWHEAERIYDLYVQCYGSGMSMERIAERGGFSWDEVPVMWRILQSRQGKPPYKPMGRRGGRDLPHSFWHLSREVSEWANKMFPDATLTSILLHLKKEVKELTEAQTPEDEALELADIMMLLMHFANKRGYDLVQNGWDKLAIVKTRSWVLGEDGVYEHRR